jgi:hypothetical protein
MSRTTLCILTAAALAGLSLTVMMARYLLLGNEVKVPAGPGTWKVTMLIQGRAVGNDARLMTGVALNFGKQQIANEACRSAELLAKPPDARHPQRHQILWTQRGGIPEGPFRAHYQFYCTVDVHAPTPPMSKLARMVYAPPHAGDQVQTEPRIEADHPEIAALSRRLAGGLDNPRDQLTTLYRYVEQEIDNEPKVNGHSLTAVECLRNGSGDSAAKGRLLVALCRNRGIPARVVTGLTLRRGHEQTAHVWVEAWVQEHWVPACPSYHHLGHVPPTYLVFAYGDIPLVRGRNVRDLDYAFLVEHPEPPPDTATDGLSRARQVLTRLSLYALPPAEQRLVEFLLLLPIAALIVCIYRNVIGMCSFGTFAPALVGLAFRDLGGMPGMLVFVSIVLLGWLMRRVLNYYHLLQVPRVAFLLSLVVLVLIGSIVAANFRDLPATKYISLFPMVILTGMIERFWTMETEDGTSSSFRTLLSTLVIAVSISLVLGLHAVVRHLFRFPETLGLIMAAQLLLGRYTGYRLSELLRFRDLMALQSQ